MKIILLFVYAFLFSSTISYAQNAHTESKKWLMNDGPYKYIMEGRGMPKSRQYDIFDNKTGTFRKGTAEEMCESVTKELQEFYKKEKEKSEKKRDRKRERDDYNSYNVIPYSNPPSKSPSRRRVESYSDVKYKAETFSKENKELQFEMKGINKRTTTLKGISKEEKKNGIKLKGLNIGLAQSDRKITYKTNQEPTPNHIEKKKDRIIKSEENYLDVVRSSNIAPPTIIKYAKNKGNYIQQMWKIKNEDGSFWDEVESNSFNHIKRLPVNQLTKEIRLYISNFHMGQTIINLKDKIKSAIDIENTLGQSITSITDYIAHNAVNDIYKGNCKPLKIITYQVVNDVDNLVDRNVPGYVKMTYTREDASKKTSNLFFKSLGL